MRLKINCKESLRQRLVAGLATFFTVIGLLTSTFAVYSSVPRLTSSSDGSGLLGGSHKDGSPTRHRFAIVHLIDSFSPAYGSALLGSAHRLIQLHSNISDDIFSGTLDLVVMVPEWVNTTGYEHPYIRYVYFNDRAIRGALQGKIGGWGIATHLKLYATNLDDYDKAVFVDLDILTLSQLVSILLDTTPPAMVQWGEYPKVDFNSGFHIFRPNREMFRDMIDVLHQLGPGKVALEELRNMSTENNLQKSVPTDPTRWSGYRSDQEFLFAFYDIIPLTRSKWGPIHPLPYRYNAREESLAGAANAFLEGKAHNWPEPTQYNGAHLHLFGGFGHDGHGHRMNPSPKEDGTFGLVAVHMTTRKPWREWQFQDLDESLVTNWTLTPLERCPHFINQVEFWDSILKGMADALVDQRYGYLWTADTRFDYLQENNLVKRCYAAELQSLLSLKKNIESQATNVCPDATDCANKHCRWRSAEQSCNQTLPFSPLIDNQSGS